MNKMQKKIFIAATLLGLLGVVLGAFAAHGLRSVLTESALESFQTGVRYQIYHALYRYHGPYMPCHIPNCPVPAKGKRKARIGKKRPTRSGGCNSV